MNNAEYAKLWTMLICISGSLICPWIVMLWAVWLMRRTHRTLKKRRMDSRIILRHTEKIKNKHILLILKKKVLN